MFVALVAKTIFKPKNGVVTGFITATNLRQTKSACRKFFSSCVRGEEIKKKAPTEVEAREVSM